VLTTRVGLSYHSSKLETGQMEILDKTKNYFAYPTPSSSWCALSTKLVKRGDAQGKGVCKQSNSKEHRTTGYASQGSSLKDHSNKRSLSSTIEPVGIASPNGADLNMRSRSMKRRKMKEVFDAQRRPLTIDLVKDGSSLNTYEGMGLLK